MLVHSVYFYLKPELSAAQIEGLFASAESLKSIPSVEQVFTGKPAPVAARPVLDKSYGLALNVLFKDVASHDAYQVHPLHKAFLEQNKGLWSRVAVFDSL